MSCETRTEDLIAVLESTAPPATTAAVLAHIDGCETCRAEMDGHRALRARLVASAAMSAAASAAASARHSLEDRVMAQVSPGPPAVSPTVGLDMWLSRLFLGARSWRLGLGTAGLAVLLAVVAAALLRAPSHAWSIEQSIEAARPFLALHLRGTFGGNARCELWARTASDDRARRQRVLIRIAHGPTIWTEGNATHYHEPDSGVVYTDDAQTAGFNPWPGPRLLEMARAAGVRMVETRWRFPGRRSVVTEWSLFTTRGPTSARAEFDVESKLLVSLRQWDNMDRRGAPGFQADDITYLQDLPDEAFAVDLPAGVQYQPKPVEVAESVLGLLSLEDTGIPTPDVPPDEAGRLIVAEMWQKLMARDVEGFKQLCPVTRGWSDEFLQAMLGGADDPDAVVEVVSVGPAVRRGHSRLGPLSVVTSHVRHRDGGLYEEKTIVQHRLTEPTPSCVIYSSYGQPYRLE